MSPQLKVGDWCQVINESQYYDGLVGQIISPFFPGARRGIACWMLDFGGDHTIRLAFSVSNLRLISEIPLEEQGLVLSLQGPKVAKTLAQIFRQST